MRPGVVAVQTLKCKTYWIKDPTDVIKLDGDLKIKKARDGHFATYNLNNVLRWEFCDYDANQSHYLTKYDG